MRAVKQNFTPVMTWLGCLIFAFATLTEIRNYSRNEPGLLARGAQALQKSTMAAQAAYAPGGDLRPTYFPRSSSSISKRDSTLGAGNSSRNRFFPGRTARAT